MERASWMGKPPSLHTPEGTGQSIISGSRWHTSLPTSLTIWTPANQYCSTWRRRPRGSKNTLTVVHWLHCTSPTSSRALPSPIDTVSYTHLRAHETRHDIVCRLLLEKKK